MERVLNIVGIFTMVISVLCLAALTVMRGGYSG